MPPASGMASPHHWYQRMPAAASRIGSNSLDVRIMYHCTQVRSMLGHATLSQVSVDASRLKAKPLAQILAGKDDDSDYEVEVEDAFASADDNASASTVEASDESEELDASEADMIDL